MVTILDSFEDGDISEYGGETGGFVVQSNVAFDGSNALEYDGGLEISRTDVSVATGETPFGAFLRGDSTTFGDFSRPVFTFATQAESNSPACYLLEIDVGGSGQTLTISKRDGGGTISALSETSASLSTATWYKVVVTQWTSNGDITAEVRETDDTVISSVSVTDTTYSSGGIGWRAQTGTTLYYDYAFKPTQLAPPSNVQITDGQTEGELTLDWDTAGTNANGYYVYRAQSSGSSTSDYTQVADVTSPPYTDTGLEDGEQYFYRVSSHD